MDFHLDDFDCAVRLNELHDLARTGNSVRQKDFVFIFRAVYLDDYLGVTGRQRLAVVLYDDTVWTDMRERKCRAANEKGQRDLRRVAVITSHD